MSYHINVDYPDQLQQLCHWSLSWEIHFLCWPHVHHPYTRQIWSFLMAQASSCWPTSTQLSAGLSVVQLSFSMPPFSLTMLSQILCSLSTLLNMLSLVLLRSFLVEWWFCINSKMNMIISQNSSPWYVIKHLRWLDWCLLIATCIYLPVS